MPWMAETYIAMEVVNSLKPIFCGQKAVKENRPSRKEDVGWLFHHGRMNIHQGGSDVMIVLFVLLKKSGIRGWIVGDDV
ncbi:unnamed protein product [Sympodiomycopsis kandeliae]